MYREELNRRRRAYAGERARRSGPFAHGHSEWSASADDRWKDRLILFVGIMVSVVVLLKWMVEGLMSSG